MVPMVVGAVLMGAFVWHAFRTPTPLLDLHLFANPRLTIAVVTMALFAIGVFGAMLLYPQYYIGVRGETTLMAGLLVAPQGIGAMITMPIAGRMTDRIGPGKFVVAGSCWSRSALVGSCSWDRRPRTGCSVRRCSCRVSAWA